VILIQAAVVIFADLKRPPFRHIFVPDKIFIPLSGRYCATAHQQLQADSTTPPPMKRLEFINMSGSDGAAGLGDALSVTRSSRRRIRVQVMKDFWRKERRQKRVLPCTTSSFVTLFQYSTDCRKHNIWLLS